MREYPYNCAICGGAYERCANTGQECGCSGYGGPLCWEESVVCRVERVVIEEANVAGTVEELEALQKLNVGDILTGGTYNGDGTVRIGEYALCDIVVDADRAKGMKNYVFCKVWCASCYNEARCEGKL